jgi:hypothetical protein
MMRRTVAAWLLWLPTVLVASAVAAEEVRDRHLLLDGRIIESVENAALRVGTVRKHPANPLFGEEHPWEARFDNLYPNVLFDEEERVYKIWYKTFTRDAVTEDGRPVPREQRVRGTYGKFPRKRGDGLCYAVSRDGLAWEKPRLDLHPWDDAPTNLVAVGNHGVGVFKDLRDERSERRYKMFFRAPGRNMAVRFSPDGLQWSDATICPTIAAAGDTHNNAFWAPELGRYVGITRLFAGSPRQRVVGRTESADFVNWTKAVEVLRGAPDAQVYAMPVFRHAGVYIGLPAVFRCPRNGGDDRVHTELAWSADTVAWHRIDAGTPLIPNSETDGDYDWGCAFASAPVFTKNGIRLYYGASNGPHTDWRDGFLALATLRPDGFAGYEPKDETKPAMVTTRPLAWRDGATLTITCDAAGGSVAVTVLDAAGKVLGRGRPIAADVTDAAVGWQDGDDPAPPAGKEVRLRFEIQDAKLYSFGFSE